MASKQERESALIRSALMVLVDRAGGEITYTQSEFQAIGARRGEYVLTGHVDRSGPGEPVVRVQLEASTRKGSMPVA